MKTLTFHVSGTHCPSCKIFIEDTLNEQIGIEQVQVDLKSETVSLETTLDESQHKLAEILTEKIKHNGYALSVEKKAKERKDNGVFFQALPIGLGLLVLFFLIQKSGILNFGFGGTVTPVTSFLIGLVASVSSCLAVVGGLVLSLSATVSQDKISDVKPMMLFHGGRLLSFALLGGVLGALGGAIGISFTATAILGIIASIVMIVLGLNLVGVFEKNVIALSPRVFNFFRKVEHKTSAPFFVGAGTFFLPCGFTQAMQVAALSSGSFFSGLLIMAAFALGTFPMLALLSFGSASFAGSKHAPLFFKSAGVLVIGLGAFALLAGLTGLGVIDPLFNV
ncbi:MAG: urease accessory protein UreH domain-containing protein [Minisyncoccota bacterium]